MDWKKRIIIYVLCSLMTAVALLLIGCSAQIQRDGGPTFDDTAWPSEERKFVEADLIVVDPVGSVVVTRPIIYVVVVGQPYTIKLSAQKYMSHINSEMTLQLMLPGELVLRNGETSWKGTDVAKSVEATFVPATVGSFEVIGRADNLAIGFQDQTLVVVRVEQNISTAREWLESRK